VACPATGESIAKTGRGITVAPRARCAPPPSSRPRSFSQRSSAAPQRCPATGRRDRQTFPPRACPLGCRQKMHTRNLECTHPPPADADALFGRIELPGGTRARERRTVHRQIDDVGRIAECQISRVIADWMLTKGFGGHEQGQSLLNPSTTPFLRKVCHWSLGVGSSDRRSCRSRRSKSPAT